MAGDCILCGKCMAVCPLLAATGREELAPRSKADLCRVLAEAPGTLSESDVEKLAGLCLGCGRCAEVCSQGVNVPELVSGLRAAHPDFRKWLWKTWLTRARALWPAGSAAAKLVPEQFRPEKLGQSLKMLANLSGGPGLEPIMRPESYPDHWRGKTVLLFAGCTATFVQSRWLMAALKLLDGLGVEVIPAEFKCCGSGLKSAGFADEARELVEHNLSLWREAGKPPVVTFCASCHAGLAGYGQAMEAGEAALWADTILPLSYVAQGISFVVTATSPNQIGYHHPCHAGGDDPDKRLLEAAVGDLLVAATDKQCCGFGGVMQLTGGGVTESVNRRCWDALSGARTVVTGCSACITQLKASAPDGVQVGHWLELME